MGVDAVLIRSATKMDAEAIAAATQLKVIARAGVGLDNVEVPAATKHGVLVVNAPTSNITSAAEHAVGLLLAVARRIPEASTSLRAGAWKRSSFSGVELAGKTIGVVGLGKIGQLFAARLAGFGTTLIAYDPYVSPARAAQLGIELVTLDELLERADDPIAKRRTPTRINQGTSSGVRPPPAIRSCATRLSERQREISSSAPCSMPRVEPAETTDSRPGSDITSRQARSASRAESKPWKIQRAPSSSAHISAQPSRSTSRSRSRKPKARPAAPSSR